MEAPEREPHPPPKALNVCTAPEPRLRDLKCDAYYNDPCDGERLGCTSGHNFSPLEHAAEVVGLADRHAFGP
jgi:hypothetical protein